MSALWQTKLAAWIHDPAEKALTLLRDRVGHEHGTVARLREALAGVLGEARGARGNAAVKAADQWAAAADRPQFPLGEHDSRHAAWAQVRFADEPAIIHPLSGETFPIAELADAHVDALKAVSLDHFLELVALGEGDARLAFLALWRFGPETPAADLNALWQVLPADTRIPDHSIWNHLDLVSALAGAQTDDAPALLSMSFGPVQGFIAQARSTSDLWAGSHLLSSLVWEGLREIAGSIGPDAVVFPQLRGLAAVDAWLFDEAKVAGCADAWKARLKEAEENLFEAASDANPLFAAALPNKCLVVVPKSRAAALATSVESTVRTAARRIAEDAAARLFGDGDGHWQTQIEAQLDGFPEVHWAIADWPTEITDPAAPTELRAALAAFAPAGEDFFAGTDWQILTREIDVDGAAFYRPNPGILYPAVFEAAERALAAAKATREFRQLPQSGYRCTLCGEREWLSANPAQLVLPPQARARAAGNPWPPVAAQHHHGIKEGEHLCAICTAKRLWPTLFAERVGRLIDKEVRRHVVSTHTMALATTLDRLLDAPDAAGRLQAFAAVTATAEPVALPRALLRKARQAGQLDAIKRLPGALDAAREADDKDRLDTLARRLREETGASLETYYALIKMDGDHLGGWLSGSDARFRLPFRTAWHPRVRSAVDQRFAGNATLRTYLDAARPPSPARHLAISQALNDFATRLVPHIVEDLCKGKLLYAGGDDVLAMVSVDDLPKAMLLLRLAYSGLDFADLEAHGVALGQHLRLGRGFAVLRGRLLRLMGGRATASTGAVIAHHQAPLAAVLRALDEAEGRAKGAGRNAFCLRVVKRGGGETGVIAPWWLDASKPAALATTPFGLLLRLQKALAGEEFSRRAVYLAREWLVRLPDWPGAGADEIWKAMAADRLARQFERQQGDPNLARDAVGLAVALAGKNGADPRSLLDDFLSSAEFLAREIRAGSVS